uniref:Carnitine O-acetyltransferase-like n=1 Tax=Phallusia mammillata TaxID=59560 RepID=A0A6F9DAL2_9ASCI|nr:carnitine O-acetyltransferase-like [Phallusia mammillata]
MLSAKLKIQLLRNCILGLQSQLLSKSSYMPGRFYSHQESLPHLPVPQLQQTLKKYLKTIRPLVNDADFQKTQIIVEEFGKSNGLGEQLQKVLVERSNEKENWLSDWWLEQAYLLSRASVVIYCSPSVSFPRYNFQGTLGQVQQAAKVISAILDYKIDIDNEALPVEKLGGKPLCMDQYYRVLSSCRIPGTEKDDINSFSRAFKPPQHISVVYRNNFFELVVYHADGTPLSVKELEIQLQRIVDSVTTEVPPVGILSSLDRDRWAKAYRSLVGDASNQASVKSIQQSIFTLCLDRSDSSSNKNWRSDFALNCLHGGGSQLNTGNRWFDKTIQMVVDENGGVGLVYEHAPAEGPPIAALLDHVYKFCENIQNESGSAMDLPSPKALPFNISPDLSTRIQEASETIDDFYKTIKLEVVDFKEFGKDFIKSQKMSPDSFIQIALQLTYWRLHKKQPATYESASLRQFRLGRTDTIRSCSNESQNFVENVDLPNLQVAEKNKLLKDAVTAHRQYVGEAVTGQGIDRHLLGFRLAAADAGLPAPDIIKDDSYKRAMHFNLSTSQVPSKADLCMAFGPAVLDGYGVCYNPKDSKILVAISTFDSYPDYDSKTFSEELFKAFCDMRDILISGSAKL